MTTKLNRRKSARAKLDKPQEPKLVRVPAKMSRFGGARMLIPTPKLVDELVRKIPKGKLATVGELRRRLAKEFRADVTCPLTTGIFLRIAAEAAEEDRANGRSESRLIGASLKTMGRSTLNFLAVCSSKRIV